ncbi:MAG: helix-turn-helix transcriptional regulator [Oscillibacter sp.]|nr:helix-turn-helix transcriptional regulator [Oscillibacter sp.]MEA4992362.1 helix-turn-helix transcriptional regulator [Oscillibacter sp.]
MVTSKLKQIRENAGLSQSQLAAASSVDKMAISRLERGETSILETRLKTVLALADALEVKDVRDLL